MDRKMCEFYKQGKCKFGSRCKNSHTITTVTKPIIIKDCDKFYETGMCKFGSGCKYSHKNVRVCQHYLGGHCNNGDNCRLSHKVPHSLSFDYCCFNYICMKDKKVLYTEKYYTRDGLMFYFFDKKGNRICRSRYLMYEIFNNGNRGWRKSLMYTNCIKVVEDYIKDYNVYKLLVGSLCRDLFNTVFGLYLEVTNSEYRSYNKNEVLELTQQESERFKVNLIPYGRYYPHNY